MSAMEFYLAASGIATNWGSNEGNEKVLKIVYTESDIELLTISLERLQEG